jgi:UDP-glucose 4-epimerase
MASAKRILITGVAGFIGSNLADRLLRGGYFVRGIDNLSYGIREQVPDGTEFHKQDIRSKEIYELFRDIDVVFHLAAKNQILDCQKDPVETMDINVTGTANVFEASRRAGVKKVVYAQSSVVEEGDDRTKGFYAVSKITDALLAEGYKAAYGLTTVGLRYFNVYGPRQDYRRSIPPVMSAFIIKLLKGEKPIVYEGGEVNKRDFIHVDDVNEFHLLCIKDDRVNNKVFRLGTGKNYSVIEILDAVKKLLGVDVEPVVKRMLEGDTPTQTRADIRDTLTLGWSPKVPLEEGLQTMVEYIKAEIAKGKL